MAYDYSQIPAGYYDEVFHRGKGIQSKWHQLKFTRFTERIDGLGEGGRHLDVGCGPGTLIGALKDASRSTGIDVAQAQIEYANRKYGGRGARFIVYDGQRLPFEDCSFDLVTMVEVVEHLEWDLDVALFRDIRRILRPGGRLLVSTPNYRSLWPALEWMVNRLAPVTYEDQHITRFHRQRLRRLFVECGFQQEEIRVGAYIGLAPFVAALSWKAASSWHSREERGCRIGPGFLLFGEGTR